MARLSASILAASSSAASRSYLTCLFFSNLIASALACHLALTLIYLILVSKTYSMILINVYLLLIAIPMTLLVEVGDLDNADTAVEAAVATNEVTAEETKLAAPVAALVVTALTSAS